MRFVARIMKSGTFAKAVERIQKGYEQKTIEALTDAVLEIQSVAKKSIKKTSPGDEGMSDSEKEHVVSKPGDPPNLDTGILIGSIGFNVEPERFVAEVGTSLKYGKHLEFGTKHMAARPWLEPAMRQVKKEIGPIFKANLIDVSKKAV